jgi:hypothetical protein
MEHREIPPKPGASEPDAYEFSADQSVLISRLSSRMRFVGLFTLGVGVMAVIAGVFRREMGVLFSGALYAVIGVWTERAGISFRSIATTQGSDIRHLMHALRDLKRLYTVQFWICFAALVATIVVLGSSVVARVR